MTELFGKFLAYAVKSLKKVLLSNPKLRTLLYDMQNREEFTNLYEHEKMLADSVRINNYQRAIQKYIGPSDTVLDLGTGSGILAFMAARQKAKMVYAIDHSAFIDIARKIARHNNFKNIEFVQTNSRHFSPDFRFDILLHEQIGDYLFNENMIQNILDLKSRLLKQDGRVLPGKFELFLEPTSLTESSKVPFIWENQLYGVDFSFMKNHGKELDNFKPSSYRQVWIEPSSVRSFLCEASPILAFDLNILSSEEEVPREVEVSRPVSNPGFFDGFCLFFKVIFDEEISFSTSPLLQEKTHWGNCFFRIESRARSLGEVINFKLDMPNLLDIKTWSVSTNGSS